MEESKVPPEENSQPASGRRKRAWWRIPLYMLAGIGAFVVALAIYAAVWHKPETQTAERLTIDEAGSIEQVMSEAYGKYSESRRGWVYVGADDRTYVMKVIQQATLPGGPEGEEMYFLASGEATDGSGIAEIGAFHVRPNPKEPGTLVAISSPNMHGGSSAVRPEDVQFVALSDKLWGWLVKVKEGRDPTEGLVTVSNVILAPRGEEIARLAEFPLSRIAKMEADMCERARQSHGEDAKMEEARAEAEMNAGAPAGEQAATATDAQESEDAQGEMEPEETEPEVFDLCQERKYTYRMGPAKGGIPAPITVSVSGTLDGKKVEEKTWKLVFDTKAFRYNVPDELSE